MLFPPFFFSETGFPCILALESVSLENSNTFLKTFPPHQELGLAQTTSASRTFPLASYRDRIMKRLVPLTTSVYKACLRCQPSGRSTMTQALRLYSPLFSGGSSAWLQPALWDPCCWLFPQYHSPLYSQASLCR